MKLDEQKIVHQITSEILDILKEPRNIVDVLFERGCLTSDECEEICELKSTKHFLEIISRTESNCALIDMVEALKQLGEPYDPLAQNILQIARNSGLKLTTSNHNAIVYEKVRKVNVYTNSRKRVEALGNHLKRLSHEGDKQAFEAYVKRVDTIFKKKQKCQKLDVLKQMEIADLRFTCLEAEVIKMRVFYDKSLYQNDIFKKLERVIPYTSNPTVTSMTFLARYGSSRSMNEGFETGLCILQYSKHHAENIVPCRDTGMVYYIEINLLLQIYEKAPTESLKIRILRTAGFAISHFEREPESVQNDYKRMLLLKMAFCRLGIGLFGDRIQGVIVNDEDLHVVKSCLQFVEKPEIWKGMETRRKMLYHLAKAEFLKRQRQSDMAILHAGEAHRIANEKQWTAELSPIKALLSELENEMEIKKTEETHESNNIAPIGLHLDKLESRLEKE